MHIQYLLEPMGREETKVLYTVYSTPLITSSLAYNNWVELFITHGAVSWMVQVEGCSGKVIPDEVLKAAFLPLLVFAYEPKV